VWACFSKITRRRPGETQPALRRWDLGLMMPLIVRGEGTIAKVARVCQIPSSFSPIAVANQHRTAPYVRHQILESCLRLLACFSCFDRKCLAQVCLRDSVNNLFLLYFSVRSDRRRSPAVGGVIAV
jgi:hypothetical protein